MPKNRRPQRGFRACLHLIRRQDSCRSAMEKPNSPAGAFSPTHPAKSPGCPFVTGMSSAPFCLEKTKNWGADAAENNAPSQTEQ